MNWIFNVEYSRVPNNRGGGVVIVQGIENFWKITN